MLNILHDTHPGIVKMKSLARSYVWWPKMDTKVVLLVRITKRRLPVHHYTLGNDRAALGRDCT